MPTTPTPDTFDLNVYTYVQTDFQYEQWIPKFRYAIQRKCNEIPPNTDLVMGDLTCQYKCLPVVKVLQWQLNHCFKHMAMNRTQIRFHYSYHQEQMPLWAYHQCNVSQFISAKEPSRTQKSFTKPLAELLCKMLKTKDK
jgi:hypothetical protein